MRCICSYSRTSATLSAPTSHPQPPCQCRPSLSQCLQRARLTDDLPLTCGHSPFGHRHTSTKWSPQSGVQWRPPFRLVRSHPSTSAAPVVARISSLAGVGAGGSCQEWARVDLGHAAGTAKGLLQRPRKFSPGKLQVAGNRYRPSDAGGGGSGGGQEPLLGGWEKQGGRGQKMPSAARKAGW